MNWIETQINGALVRIAFDADSIHIFDAYPIKDELKREGFRWNPDDKSWFVKGQNTQALLARLVPREKIDAAPPPAVEPQQAAAVADEHGITIRQLRDRIEGIIASQLPPRIWVRGIIVSEIKQYRWASYFDLGDDQGETPFFFRVEVPGDQLARIEKALSTLGVAQKLEKDLPVLLSVAPSLANRYVVDVRLTVHDILPEYTQSKLRNQREITLERLKGEGLADRQRGLKLPMVLSRIGIITSAQGTSLEDIRSAMAPHADRYGILFADARMEGALAVTQITGAIRRFNRMTDPVDLILLARGGGSEQSLAVFNDYRICREICLSTIPIVAAIGHEKDLSAAELCAHLLPTPSTPSGAGRFLAQRWQGLIDDLRSLMNNWLGMAFDRLSDEQDRLAALVAHLPQSLRRRRRYEQRHLADQVRLFRRQGLTMLAARQSGVRREADSCRKGALHRMAQAAVRVKKTAAGCDFRLLDQRLMAQKERVQQIAARLAFSGRRFLGLQQERLTIQSSVVGAHSPASVLRRGFTLLFDPQGKVIPTQKAFREGMKGRLHFHDGDIDVTAGESGEQK